MVKTDGAGVGSEKTAESKDRLRVGKKHRVQIAPADLEAVYCIWTHRRPGESAIYRRIRWTEAGW